MRIRTLALVTGISLLGAGAQVDAHGGGGFIAFHGGGFHGGFAGAPRFRAPIAPAASAVAAATTPAAVQFGVRRTDFRDDRGQDRDFNNGFRRDDGGFGRDGFGRDGFRNRFRNGFGSGLLGGDVGFAPTPQRLSRGRPVLNYYYSAGDNYYSNPVSDYYAAGDACPGWRWDPASQTRVWVEACRG
jgi:hypothetical protein